MNIHEYQGKTILARYGINILMGIPAFTVDEAAAAAEKIIESTGNETVVVKAQIHAGGRGKGGGVKVVQGAAAVRAAAEKLLDAPLVTHQTGPDGQVVRRLYIEAGVDIARELYVGLVVDREASMVALMASTDGGVDIEKIAAKSPERIYTEHLDPLMGLTPYQARKIAYALNVGARSPKRKETVKQFIDLLLSLGRCFCREDASLAEINPVVITQQGDVVALDAKMGFDPNAEPRHPEWDDLIDIDEEDPVEREAKQVGLSYVSLDGNIGCLVNGAGLAMSTMDIIKHYGGEPANFLDIGGGATKEMVTTAFKMILSSPKVKGIFVNIFGGIMKCDLVAEGIVAAAKELGLTVPLVVRLEGTNVDAGKEILKNSGLEIEAADSMADGTQKIVAAVS